MLGTLYDVFRELVGAFFMQPSKRGGYTWWIELVDMISISVIISNHVNHPSESSHSHHCNNKTPHYLLSVPRNTLTTRSSQTSV